MSKTLGLALGSGGARGVAHIGFLQALEEENIRPSYIAGCSMGALVGGLYASGMSALQMKELALSLKSRDLLDLSLGIITRMSLLRTKKAQELFLQHLGDKRIEDFKIPFKCVATDVYTGELQIFSEGEAAKVILASCSIPTVFRPVEYEGKLLVDGGVLCRLPSKIVKDMGADVVIAVDVLKNTSEQIDKLNNIFDLILRIYDIMDSHQTALLQKVEKEAADIIIKPEMKGLSQYAIKGLDKAYAEGYEAGKEYLPQIKALLERQ